MAGDEPVRHVIDDVQTGATESAQASEDLIDERSEGAGEVAADIPLEVAPLPFTVPNLMHVRSVGRSNGRSLGSGRGSGSTVVLGGAEAPLPVVGDAGAIGDQLVLPSFLPELLLGQSQDALGFPEAPLAVALGG